MDPVITLRQEHLDQMIAHALEDAPNECCGLIAAREGRVTALHRAVNAEASPYRFSIDFREQRRIEEAMDAAGDSLAGFYHSHTGSPARPSPTDIRMMGAFFGPPDRRPAGGPPSPPPRAATDRDLPRSPCAGARSTGARAPT